MNLLESYKGRLSVAESFYAKTHNNEKMSNQKKLVTAKMLENCNKFLNEAFENSVGTQRSDMGAYRKFALNLTTVAVPNLIAFDLVFVYPMSSMSGFINYLTYTAGSNKGETKKGEVFNSPRGLGKVDPNYTSSKVVEAVTAGEAFAPAWTPVEGTVRFFVNGAWAEAVDAPETVPTGATKVAYEYDNVVIPQNDLPILNAKMESVDLHAKARRIAIYYSQIAAYQA